MPRARLVLGEKIIDESGNIFELVIWHLPTRGADRRSIRYRLAFVRAGEATPAVLYDNHEPKGHHRHLRGVEKPYAFIDVDRLIADFVEDVRRVIGEFEWPGR